MSAGLFVTLCGLTIAALSAMLGVWVERDPQRPPRYAVALSVLILLSTFVGLAQAYLKHQDGVAMQADMARILDDLDRMAGRDPELDAYVSEQVRVQAAAHPEVINLLAERVEARGEVAATVLEGRGLSPGDLQQMGLAPMQKETSKRSQVPAAPEAPATPAPGATPAEAPAAEAADTDAPGKSEEAASDKAAPGKPEKAEKPAPGKPDHDKGDRGKSPP